MIMNVGNKVQFSYYDFEKEKEISGVGWIKEVDRRYGLILIKTTRTIHWMEYNKKVRNVIYRLTPQQQEK